MQNDMSPESLPQTLHRETPAWRQMELMDQLNQNIIPLALSGLRLCYPHATADELRYRLADMLLGLDSFADDEEDGWLDA